MRMGSPADVHSRAVRSSPALAISSPVDQFTTGRGRVWATRRRRLPLLSQIARDGGIAPMPRELVTKFAPLGDQSADSTHELWSVMVRRTFCPATSQSFARSSLAVE